MNSAKSNHCKTAVEALLVSPQSVPRLHCTRDIPYGNRDMFFQALHSNQVPIQHCFSLYHTKIWGILNELNAHMAYCQLSLIHYEFPANKPNTSYLLQTSNDDSYSRCRKLVGNNLQFPNRRNSCHCRACWFCVKNASPRILRSNWLLGSQVTDSVYGFRLFLIDSVYNLYGFRIRIPPMDSVYGFRFRIPSIL